MNSWGQNLNCGGNFIFVGGTEVHDEAVSGTMIFDGNGNVTGSFTEYGRFDQTSSNATVSCANNGSAVYFAPANGTLAGTYSIQSTGDGSVNLTITGGVPGGGNSAAMQFKLAGNCPSGVANTALTVELKSDNSVENSGILRFQSTC
jgi:hypothetical protein